MLNAAWRMNNGVVHPYIGGGVGVGVTTVEFAPDEDDTATAVAGQVFFGFDYDILENLYVGVNGRWLITEPEVFGFDETFHLKWVSTTIRCARIGSRMACQADERTGNMSELPRSKAKIQGWFAGIALARSRIDAAA